MRCTCRLVTGGVVIATTKQDWRRLVQFSELLEAPASYELNWRLMSIGADSEALHPYEAWNWEQISN